jgi:hypothetical protein
MVSVTRANPLKRVHVSKISWCIYFRKEHKTYIHYKDPSADAFSTGNNRRYPENHTKPIYHVCKQIVKCLVLKQVVFIVTTLLQTVSRCMTAVS